VTFQEFFGRSSLILPRKLFTGIHFRLNENGSFGQSVQICFFWEGPSPKKNCGPYNPAVFDIPTAFLADFFFWRPLFFGLPPRSRCFGGCKWATFRLIRYSQQDVLFCFFWGRFLAWPAENRFKSSLLYSKNKNKASSYFFFGAAANVRRFCHFVSRRPLFLVACWRDTDFANPQSNCQLGIRFAHSPPAGGARGGHMPMFSPNQ
jgi:hypothetical protein